MTATQGRFYYQTLNRQELIEVILQRDSALLAAQHDMINVTGELKWVQRILNLRNKKLFGVSSEQSSRLGLSADKSDAIEEIECEDRMYEIRSD